MQNIFSLLSTLFLIFLCGSTPLFSSVIYPLIEKIEVTPQTIHIIAGKHFKERYLKDDFFINYHDSTIDLTTLDESILVMPFLFDTLSTILSSNETYTIDSLDTEVEICFEKIRKIWMTMFPEERWVGKLIAKNRIVHNFNFSSDRVLMLFSGGIDSTYSSLQNLDKKQLLFTIQGHTDSSTEKQWHETKKIINHICSQYGHEATSAFTLSPFIIRCDPPRRARTIGTLRWIGKTIPLMICKGISHLYVPATITLDYPFVYHNPQIDNLIRFGDCIRVFRDGINTSRTEKTAFLVNFFKSEGIKEWPLKVCLYESSGKNCSFCSKCVRTINDILILGGDPLQFGFLTSPRHTQVNLKNYLNTFKTSFEKYSIDKELEIFFMDGLLTYLETHRLYESNKHAKWLYDFLVNHPVIMAYRQLSPKPYYRDTE